MYAIIHPIEPFDSSIGTEIKFTWRGNQIYKVRCIVKNNETGTIVYDRTESTMKQSYTMPTNSGLVNGVYYVIYITVFDVNNIESDLQDIGTPFYCFTKPLFNLSVSDSEIIQTSAYKVGINYSQVQDEALDSYSITLYTYQKTVLSSSGDIYNTSDMSYVVSGLENAKQYYLRATGKTLHGITLDTGFILITVSYTIAQVFNTLELNNKAESGAIEIKSNIVSAIGLSEKDVIYIGDEYADLRDNSVTFDEGFEVRGDFTKIFVFYEPERNKSIISFGDGDRLKVDIYYRIGKYADSNGEKAYFELVANSCGTNYVMNSNYVDIPNLNYQQFALLVNRQGAYYDLKVVLISTIIRYSANADGSNMTETKQTNSRYVGVGYMPTEVMQHENLTLNSSFKKVTSSSYGPVPVSFGITGDGTLTSAVDGDVCSITKTSQPASVRKVFSQNLKNETISAGTVMTFSLDVLIPDNFQNPSNASSISLREYKTGNSASTESGISIGSVPINIWTRLTMTKVILQNKVDRGEINCAIYFGADAHGTISTRNWKLEISNIATPWTPAPSDWVVDPKNFVWKPL